MRWELEPIYLLLIVGFLQINCRCLSYVSRVSDKIVGASGGLQPPSLGVTKGILQGPTLGKQNVLDPGLSQWLCWGTAIKIKSVRRNARDVFNLDQAWSWSIEHGLESPSVGWLWREFVIGER